MTNNNPSITDDLISEHGLSADEYKQILSLLGRSPSLTELGIFSAMWNEHCSYKSSKKWLKTLPTTGKNVIFGPGENAGVIDAGDGDVIVFKMESHNHPSFIEPFQGAATGVGGILRDIFTMGARPVAVLNALRFGEASHPKTKYLMRGVVSGIAAYGNCFGVPNIGGETEFHPSYNENNLTNAMAIGITKRDKIFTSTAKGIGNPIIYFGAKTGRDGIHGAMMASAEFDENSDEKRPTVQVGDPFMGKILMEACLELMQSDDIIAIQDMGAAGLTCSAVEMGAKGNLGVLLNLDKVPQQESGMSAYEIMLSESQERMLMVLRPEGLEAAFAIFKKWGIHYAHIGETTDDLRFKIQKDNILQADLPIKQLGDMAPEYDRPYKIEKSTSIINDQDYSAIKNPLQILKKMLSSHNGGSKKAIWENYDYLVQGQNIQKPGGNAGIIRIANTQKAIAATTDVKPRYVKADPITGGQYAVAETWRNLSAVGADPIAITDNMNFGNPEKPEIMGQFVGAIQGISSACKALDYPVVSGNVSLYNETDGRAINPTPAIGGVGIIKDISKIADHKIKRDNDILCIVGDMRGELGCSDYLLDILGIDKGLPPKMDLPIERKNGDFIRKHIQSGHLDSVNDISGGGLLMALAKMCIYGDIGAEIAVFPDAITLFGEGYGRYLLSISTDHIDIIKQAATDDNIPLVIIGKTGGDDLKLSGEGAVNISDLSKAYHDALLDLL